MQELAPRKSRTLPDATTVVGMLWVGTTVYERLWAASVDLATPAAGWLASVITLAVAWSVMSRKRWGRLALLGIAALGAGSAAWSLGSYFAVPGVPFLRHAMPPMLAAAIPGEGEHSVVMASVDLILALITLIWLARTRVRSEFEVRKAAVLRSYQVGIALFLVLCWVSSEVTANRWPVSVQQPPAAAPVSGPVGRRDDAAFRTAWRRAYHPYGVVN